MAVFCEICGDTGRVGNAGCAACHCLNPNLMGRSECEKLLDAATTTELVATVERLFAEVDPSVRCHAQTAVLVSAAHSLCRQNNADGVFIYFALTAACPNLLDILSPPPPLPTPKEPENQS